MLPAAEESTDGDTGQQVPLEVQVYHELCRARTDPRSYISSLRARLPHFVGTSYAPPELGGKTQLATMEGRLAVNEAIEFLEKQTPLDPPVLEGDEVAQLLNYDVEVETLDRVYVKGTPAERRKAALKGVKKNRWVEFTWFGPAGSPATKIVEDLIVNDGLLDRHHRSAVFNPSHGAVKINARRTSKGRMFCKLHFSNKSFQTKPCRSCGRCHACDMCCTYCWSVHHSPITSSRCTSRGSARPRTNSPGRVSSQNTQFVSRSEPCSPTGCSSCDSPIAGDFESRGVTSPSRSAGVVTSPSRSARSFMSEGRLPRHTYLAHPPPPKFEEPLFDRPSSTPSLASQYAQDASGGSTSWPGAPHPKTRVTQDVRINLRDLRSVTGWHHQIQGHGLKAANNLSGSLPALHMVHT